MWQSLLGRCGSVPVLEQRFALRLHFVHQSRAYYPLPLQTLHGLETRQERWL